MTKTAWGRVSLAAAAQRSGSQLPPWPPSPDRGKTLLCCSFLEISRYTQVTANVYGAELLPMETRSWPPLGRSHWPRVGKTFWRENSRRPESFSRLWERGRTRVRTVKVEKVKLIPLKKKPYEMDVAPWCYKWMGWDWMGWDGYLWVVWGIKHITMLLNNKVHLAYVGISCVVS